MRFQSERAYTGYQYPFDTFTGLLMGGTKNWVISNEYSFLMMVRPDDSKFNLLFHVEGIAKQVYGPMI